MDPRFSVVENANHPKLSNIFFASMNYDLPTIATNDIREEVDQSYRYEFPNGMKARFWSRPEILARLEQFLIDYKAEKYEGMYE